MHGDMKTGVRYHLGSIGYLFIIAGVFGGPVLVWWLSSGGDIIEVLHRLRTGLPGWGWTVLKYGLAVAFGVFFMLALIALGMLILYWGNKESAPRQGNH